VNGGGSWIGDTRLACEGPLHRVTVRPFWIGRSVVTNAEYVRFLDENPGEPVPRRWPSGSSSDVDPVVGVSWEAARRFARWARCRLPSEAEWEFVGRLSESERQLLGIRDLFGRVVQWVEDDWHPSYWSAPTDGSAWVENPRAPLRVVRGTAWFNDPKLVRPSLRSWDQPLAQDDFIGFRLACSAG
jgi:formylglycine-generating enzyme required for sulfatase activity